MSRLIIEGGNSLNGEINIHGAKNSVLPILAATILCSGECIIHNCPYLSDVDTSIEILRYLGCKVKREKDTLIINTDNISKYEIPDTLMRKMRSSIIFLGAILSRLKKAKLSFPGGCELGPRPIDLHLNSLREMGIKINERHGLLECSKEKEMLGSKISLSFPSVGATENLLLVAAISKGTTIISNAAKEPEITDLINYLNRCGAKIFGLGESTLIIRGVDKLTGSEHFVIPDRIAAATFMSAVAITGGDVNLKKIKSEHLASIIPVFEDAGCKMYIKDNCMRFVAPKKLKSIKTIRTMPYPGFPTDAQAPLMAMATLAKGTSVFIENIFESRYKHVGELFRLGANIKVEGRVAVVEGVEKLFGAFVEASDLRGAASLVIAALAADGITEVSGLNHLDRGYENIEESLNSIGAKTRRIE